MRDDPYRTAVGRPDSECDPHLAKLGEEWWLVVGTRPLAKIRARTLTELRAMPSPTELVQAGDMRWLPKAFGGEGD